MTEIKNKTIECYFHTSIEMFSQNNFDYHVENNKLIAQSMNALEKLDNFTISDFKIPTLTHQIWLTSNINPQTIDSVPLNLTISTLLELNRASDQWTHYIWTNNLAIIPDQLRNIPYTQFMLIDEFSDHRLWPELQETLTKGESNKSLLAQAGDIIRYIILERKGGIYRDFDHLIFENRSNDLLKLMSMANFLASKVFHSDLTPVGNSFIAASPNHPILEDLINSIKKNLHPEEHPEIAEYIKYPCVASHGVLYTTGPTALIMSTFKAANQPGYVDLLMPSLVFSNTEYARHLTKQSKCYDATKSENITNDFQERQITSIAGDLLCGSWYYQNQANKKIIDYGPNVSSDIFIKYRIFGSVMSGHLPDLEYYLQYTQYIEALKEGFTPLYTAVRLNQSAAAELLLKKGANPHFIDNEGNSLLHIAAKSGHSKIFELLLQTNIDLNIKHPNGASALTMAVINGHKETVKLLLNAGADKTISVANLSLEEIAIKQNHLEVAELLKNDLNELLFSAISKGNQTLVEKYLDQGAAINYVFNASTTPLLTAIEKNYTSIVDLLLKRGVDANMGNPLLISAKLGHSQITKLLLEAGSNPDVTNYFVTPLYKAVYHSNLQDVEYLLRYNVTLQSDDIITPLSTAGYLKDQSSNSKQIYDLMINHYWQWLEQERKTLPMIDNQAFQVVIVRYKEDLHCLGKEFYNDTNIIIYNKGPEDLDYVNPHYKIINTPNIGWFGGNILLHIANNYDQLANRTLFLQGSAHDHMVFLPLLRYAADLDSICSNIIAKCSITNLVEEKNQLFTEGWMTATQNRYNQFKPLNYSIIDFFHQHIDPDFSLDKTFAVDLGAQFAVDIDKIKFHSKQYYKTMLTYFNETYATADFYLERAWDPLFGNNNFNDVLESISKIKLSPQTLHKLLVKTIQLGNFEAVQNLLEAGAKLDDVKSILQDKLIQAIDNNDITAAKTLLKYKMNLEFTTKNGNSPLQLAAIKGYADIADLLLKAGANLDEAHKNGASALTMAVINGHKETVKLLLKAGADRTISVANLSLEEIAIKQNHPEVAELLKNDNFYEEQLLCSNNIDPIGDIYSEIVFY